MPKNISGLRAQTESRRATLGLGSRGAYSIESLESGQFTQKQLRQEYSRLRTIAKKRFERLAESEWATKEGKTPYNYRMENYPTLRELQSDRQLALKLRDLASVIESPRSRIYGLEQIREESVRTMQEEGYTWVTKENWREFSDFMAVARTMANNRQFDSERAVEMFGEMKETGGTETQLLDAFQEYLDSEYAQVDNIPEVRR